MLLRRRSQAGTINKARPIVTVGPHRDAWRTHITTAIVRMFSQIDKQIVRAWHEYLLEPRLAKLTGRVLRRTGPRIAVIGNCQAFGIALQ